ncbi:MAG: bifunctional 2-C-methyl-D-erythritol 4-phosphate cytidylyltransferase/2-C-methyl-D-erythritol 2,4-cyclodiphosphate synthase [Paracoccaceae bacterium]|nr:MAG: bifunctional 2-C-methyl-D-erythritol 4-phosphate cytidylyltransferase/2-C-methyl-D-erythritol 2,4-cyclodiphosphate synthase [Paracoccaceae bacterium]
MRIASVIVAAGRGTRMGGDLPKQWRPLAGRPLAAHAAAALAAHGPVVAAIHPADRAMAKAALPGLRLVEGGETRAASVRAALEALADDPPDIVLIHDGARPFPTAGLVARLIAALNGHPAAAPALPVSDALWRGAGGLVAGVQDRAGLYRAQTPQAFRFAAILAAHRGHAGEAADDVAVARAAGLDVAIVEGDEDNLKLTFPGDFARAEAIMRGRSMDIRTGNGFDVHAFCEGDHVWLCGVKVPHDRGLLGHSDADVGMHALTDAIYGALAEGDIGRHFPPSDPQWKGAASHIFLRHAADRAAARGFRIGNADVTLICERPKIGPHAVEMAAELGRIMAVEASRVSVKATTSERLGFTGRQEGIAAIATVTLVSP